MKQTLLALGGLLILALGIAAAPAEDKQTLQPMPDKPEAYDFTLPDVDGNTHTLSDYRGKVVILNFWATWCPPCRREMPSMERAWKQLDHERFAMLAVDVGETADEVFTFTADYPVSFPLLLDRDSQVVEQYPVLGLPTTFVVDPQGRMAYRAVGGREWDSPALLERVRALAEQ